MATLTKSERVWIGKLQKLLSECPSDRIGAYTVGDASISLYDRSKDQIINEHQDESGIDFCTAVERNDADLGEVKFPFPVHSTCG